MREIEFRFFDNEKKTFYYFTIKDLFIGFGTDYDCPPNVPFLEDSFDKIEQYTGLKDKNKNKIFKNDIIFCSGLYFTIIFDKGCFYAETKYHRFTLNRINTDCELKGNIHESQELLK